MPLRFLAVGIGPSSLRSGLGATDTDGEEATGRQQPGEANE